MICMNVKLDKFILSKLGTLPKHPVEFNRILTIYERYRILLYILYQYMNIVSHRK